MAQSQHDSASSGEWQQSRDASSDRGSYRTMQSCALLFVPDSSARFDTPGPGLADAFYPIR